MKICAIICEYNPLHNGHLRHIEESRKATDCDAVLCLMSGDFVQRGEAAILDKFTRARLAVEAGADIVLELPTLYSLSNAENFAYGAVKILNAVPAVTHLSFGSEHGELDPIWKLAAFFTNESPAFKKLVTEHLGRGATLATAKTSALISVIQSGGADIDVESAVEILSSPNNILALEYLKAMIVSGSKFQPVTMKREGSSYNSTELTGAFSSASAIRRALAAGCYEEAAVCMPPFVTETLKKAHKSNTLSRKTLSDILLYRLRTMSAEEIGELYDVAEGLENRIKTLANFATGYESLVDAVKTKRYTHARLRRILLYAALGITKKAAAKTAKAEPYAKVLAVKKGRQDVLSAVGGSKLQLLARAEDYKQALSGANDLSVKIDLRAADVYALLNSDPALKMGGQDLTTPLLFV